MREQVAVMGVPRSSREGIKRKKSQFKRRSESNFSESLRLESDDGPGIVLNVRAECLH